MPVTAAAEAPTGCESRCLPAGLKPETVAAGTVSPSQSRLAWPDSATGARAGHQPVPSAGAAEPDHDSELQVEPDSECGCHSE